MLIDAVIWATETAQDIGQAGSGALLQYGALGILAGLALLAVRVLFAQLAKTLDLERARADRAEAEVRALNTAIQERYLTTLAQATTAISEALAVTRREH